MEYECHCIDLANLGFLLSPSQVLSDHPLAKESGRTGRISSYIVWLHYTRYRRKVGWGSPCWILFSPQGQAELGLLDFCQWASTVRTPCHLFCLLHLHSLSLPTRHLPVNPRWKPRWQRAWHPTSDIPTLGFKRNLGYIVRLVLKKNQNNNKIPNKDKNKPWRSSTGSHHVLSTDQHPPLFNTAP